MEALKRLRFFEANPEFAILEPDPYAYGRRARIDASAGTVEWFDARFHGLTVKRVGESTRTKLVIFDRLGRKFVFVPMTARFYLARVWRYGPKPKTDDEARKLVREDGYE